MLTTAAPATGTFCDRPWRPSLHLCAGRERVQSAGRARKLGSRFVEIVEATPGELALVRKARQEEQNMKAALAGLASVRIS